MKKKRQLPMRPSQLLDIGGLDGDVCGAVVAEPSQLAVLLELIDAVGVGPKEDMASESNLRDCTKALEGLTAISAYQPKDRSHPILGIASTAQYSDCCERYICIEDIVFEVPRKKEARINKRACSSGGTPEPLIYPPL